MFPRKILKIKENQEEHLIKNQVKIFMELIKMEVIRRLFLKNRINQIIKHSFKKTKYKNSLMLNKQT